MANRLFLHVGCPKTGTSFLQDLVWNNQERLHEQGLLVPAPRRAHFRASMVVRNVWRRRPNADEIHASWEELLDDVRRADDDVLISHEMLSVATAQQASRAIGAFDAEQTHIVITARDLARQVLSGWQQHVKQGSTYRLDDFIDDVRRRKPSTHWFWRAQDIAGIADRWGATLPAGQVHVVTVPPKGADSDQLWPRFAAALDVPPESIPVERARSNESLGRVEVELLRRTNEVRAQTGSRRQNQLWFRDILANAVLAARPNKQRFDVDESLYQWARAQTSDLVSSLSRRGYDVVGNLEDLVPVRPPSNGTHAEASEQEVTLAAIDTIVSLMERQIEADARNKREEPEQEPQPLAERRSVVSRLKSTPLGGLLAAR
ncbi:MAG: hypothetical protein ACRDOY_10530 [Nocardioidaceae bacterium]